MSSSNHVAADIEDIAKQRLDENQRQHHKPRANEDESSDQPQPLTLSVATSRRSSSNFEAIEPVSVQEDVPEDAEKGNIHKGRGSREVARKSQELRKSASNVLSRVATHLTTRSLPEPPPPPDGGVKAWTQVACGWLVIFTTWGYVNSFGAFQAYYTEILPQSPSAISWIGSIQVWLTFFVGAFSGRLLDAGLFLPTMVVGSAVQLLGVFLMSVSTQYWHLMLTQGVLTGIGAGIFFTPCSGLIATYFDKRRAVAMGISTLGNACGGLVYPLVVRELLPRVGFGWTARVLGFINLFCLGIAAVFMRPRLPPRTAGAVIDWSAFKEPVYVTFVIGLFFIIWAYYYTFYFIASFGTQALGMSYSAATTLVIIINVVSIPTRIIMPFLADRFGCMNVVLPINLALCITAFCWLAVRDVPGYYGFTVIYGMCSGGFHCLIPTTIASITPRLDMVGTRLGMAFTIISFASLTGPPLGGALQNSMSGSFTGASAWAAVSTSVCFGLFCVSRAFKTEWKLRGKC